MASENAANPSHRSQRLVTESPELAVPEPEDPTPGVRSSGDPPTLQRTRPRMAAFRTSMCRMKGSLTLASLVPNSRMNHEAG